MDCILCKFANNQYMKSYLELYISCSHLILLESFLVFFLRIPEIIEYLLDNHVECWLLEMNDKLYKVNLEA